MESLVSPDLKFWSGKRVLITGHTGFKGAWLALWLSRLHAKVFGVSLPAPTEPSLFADADIQARVDTTYCDIRDAAAVAAVFARVKPDIVLHLAAQSLVLPSYREPVETFATNVMGTVHVLDAVRATPSVRSVVIVTTDKCYENREWLWAYREDDMLGGYDPYSASKACAELVTSAWRRSFCGLNSARQIGLASARAGNVFGGGDWAVNRLIPDCMRALGGKQPIGVRNPRATRPWQHVLNPLAGYMTLAERLWHDPVTYGEAWNFGPADDDIKPVSEIVSRITNIWGDGARWELIPSDAPHEAGLLKVDASKARARLGWQPMLHLDVGLDWTCDWYKRAAAGQSIAALTENQITQFERLLLDDTIS